MAEQRQPEADKKDPVEKHPAGHHLPPEPGDAPPVDDTDRNTDRVVTPPTSPDRTKSD